MVMMMLNAELCKKDVETFKHVPSICTELGPSSAIQINDIYSAGSDSIDQVLIRAKEFLSKLELSKATNNDADD